MPEIKNCQESRKRREEVTRDKLLSLHFSCDSLTTSTRNILVFIVLTTVAVLLSLSLCLFFIQELPAPLHVKALAFSSRLYD